MSRQADAASSRRWLEIAAAAIIVAIPIALAAVTWEPLEPLPAVREQERAVAPTTTPDWRPRQAQRERARLERRENQTPRAIATPGRRPRAAGTPQAQDDP